MDEKELEEITIAARKRLRSLDGVKFILSQFAALNEKNPAALDLALIAVQARDSLAARREFGLDDEVPEHLLGLIAVLASMGDGHMTSASLCHLILEARILLRQQESSSSAALRAMRK